MFPSVGESCIGNLSEVTYATTHSFNYVYHQSMYVYNRPSGLHVIAHVLLHNGR